MADMNRITNSKVMRTGLKFDRELLDIQKLRIQNGVADPRRKETNSTPKLTNLIARHKMFPQIKADLSKLNFGELREQIT